MTEELQKPTTLSLKGNIASPTFKINLIKPEKSLQKELKQNYPFMFDEKNLKPLMIGAKKSIKEEFKAKNKYINYKYLDSFFQKW